MINNKSDVWISLLFFFGLVGVYYVYAAGLSGTFVFDDFNNLSSLGFAGGVDSWSDLERFILSGFSGPTGRPIALLTFLLDSNTWPADAQSFKYNNIMIHLLNGTLVFALTLSMLKFYEGSKEVSLRGKWAALFVAFLWLCHPYLVSTTLYVIQRMAQLAALFIFAGLLTWLRGRRILSTSPRSGYTWMTLGLVFFGLLATFSKENGALLVVLVLVTELTIIRHSPLQEKLNRVWFWAFVVIPSGLIAAYLVYKGFSQGWLLDYTGRDFSPWERVLTEFRVIWSYLYHWYVPHIFTTGIYHDNMIVSSGLFSPWTTITSILGFISLVVLAWKIRKEYPLVLFSVLFFLASLSIESSTIGLELVFEHRVYLGSIFLFLPLVYYALQYFNPKKASACIVVWVLLLAIFCWRGATLWGDYPSMVMVWAEKSPDSARAQIEVVRLKYESGQPEEALRWLDQSAQRIPNDFFLRMSQVLVQCKLNTVNIEDRDMVLDLSKTTTYSTTWLDLMRKGILWIDQEQCKGLTSRFILEVANNFLKQDRNSADGSKSKAQLLYIKGVTLFLSGRQQEAFVLMSELLKAKITLNRRMSIASHFLSYGYREEALNIARAVLGELKRGGIYGRELAESPSIEEVQYFIEAVRADITNA